MSHPVRPHDNLAIAMKWELVYEGLDLPIRVLLLDEKVIGADVLYNKALYSWSLLHDHCSIVRLECKRQLLYRILWDSALAKEKL
jgi:hypothetical protein